MTRRLFFSVLTCIAALATVACAGREHHRRDVPHEAYLVERPAPGAEVVIVEEPPPPQPERIPAAPSANHVWVAGYWVRHGREWIWVPGCHVLRPRPAAVWVAGHWARRPGGWVWIPGHWD
jgi:hypothetical protein